MENLLKIGLQFFAESAQNANPNDGDTEAGSANPQEGYNTAGSSNPQTTEPNQNAEEQAIDPELEFESLIGKNGKFKAQYESRVSKIVQNRLKKAKAAEETLKKVTPLLDTISGKYGIDTSDIDSLSKAIQEDDTYFEDEALKRGISVSELKHIKKIERENASLTRQIREREASDAAERQYQKWISESESLKKQFPNFDLQDELQNEQFTDLLRHGISMDVAFRVLHEKEIMPAAMQYAANAAAQATVNKITNAQKRPAENGTNAQAAVSYKLDVSKMSDKDIFEINKRVLAGEKITL